MSINNIQLVSDTSWLSHRLVLPAHKEKIESCIAILNRPPQESDKPKLKELQRIFHFYKNMGLNVLPQIEEAENEVKLRKEISDLFLKEIAKGNVPGTSQSLQAGANISESSLSFTGNILSGMHLVETGDSVMTNLGCYVGILLLFLGVKELDGGWSGYTRSKQIGDDEGLERAKANLLSGGIVSTGALTYLAGKACDAFHAAEPSVGLLMTANVLFSIGSVLALVMSGLGAYRCYDFRSSLNEYLEHPNSTRKEQLEGALRFLKEMISVTPEELNDLQAQMKPEDSLREKVGHLTETKVKYLKRRTSNQSLASMREIDSILGKLSANDPNGIKEAEALMQTIKKGNSWKMVLHSLALFAAAISILAMILTLAAIAPPLIPMILGAIGGGIYFGLTAYSVAHWVQKQFWPLVVPDLPQPVNI